MNGNIYEMCYLYYDNLSPNPIFNAFALLLLLLLLPQAMPYKRNSRIHKRQLLSVARYISYFSRNTQTVYKCID